MCLIISVVSCNRVKATVENPWDSVEKLSPKEIVKGTYTVLRSSVRTPKEFFEGKREAAKPRGRSTKVCLRKIPSEPLHCPAAQCTVDWVRN